MKVTIITATYNSAKNIKTCLDSVISQNYSDLEYLLIDGKSSDATLNILKYYQQKYSYLSVVSEEDFGIYDALNKGVQLATGDVIGFVHSDDVLADNQIISDLVAELKTKELDGVYGDLQYVKKNDLNKIVRFWKSCNFKSSQLKKGWMPPHPTLFLKRDVYRKHGLFNLDYKIAADYDFMLRILNDHSLKYDYLPKVITKMRVGGASNGSLKNIMQKTKEDYRVIKNNEIGGILTLLGKNILKIKQFL